MINANKIAVVSIGSNGGYFINPQGTSKTITGKYEPGYGFMYNTGTAYEDIYNLTELSDGRLTFEYKDNKYYIDDGYRNNLVKAGYIVMNDYDSKFIENEDEGREVREKLMTTVYNALCNSVSKSIVPVMTPYGAIHFSYTTKYTKYTVIISTVSFIVSRNKERLGSGDSVYPFAKGNDKYGTLYFAIFGQRLNDQAPATTKFSTANKLTDRLIEILNGLNDGNTYKYSPLAIKRRLFYIDSELS